VAAVRLPLHEDVLGRSSQDMGSRTIDGRPSVPAALVPNRPRITYAGDDKAMADPVEALKVAQQPAERPKSARAPEQAVCMGEPLLCQGSRERPQHDYAGEVVVRQRRVTDVRAEEKFGVGFARHRYLP